MVQVPAYMTHFFQPLDLTVNQAAKRHTRKSFVTYYSDCVSKQLEAGRNLEDIKVDLKLTVIQPLHAQWLYNYFRGKKSSLKGWKIAEVLGIIDGSIKLPPENPFQTIYEHH